MFVFWQGFQFIVDDSGGFSSVASEILEHIADEYGNIPVLLYSVRAPGSYMNLGTRKQTVFRGLHDAVSFSRLSSFSNLIVPVGLPSLSQSKLMLHVSLVGLEKDVVLFAVFSFTCLLIHHLCFLELPQFFVSDKPIAGLKISGVLVFI